MPFRSYTRRIISICCLPVIVTERGLRDDRNVMSLPQGMDSKHVLPSFEMYLSTVPRVVGGDVEDVANVKFE